MRLPFLSALAVSTLLLTSADLSALGPEVLQLDSDELFAYFYNTDLLLQIHAERKENPDGLFQFAELTLFSLNEPLPRCQSSNLNLVVTPGRKTLSFVTEEGFLNGVHCPAGEQITVTCEPMYRSVVFRRNVNGVTTFYQTGLHYTTHGFEYSAGPLACAIHAFGVDYDGQGSVSSERLTATP
jgi:hypothetical protein